jgi:uncharacterized protein with beta-barrel porin domain
LPAIDLRRALKRTCTHIFVPALGPALALVPVQAWADCTATGTQVACTGTSAAYTNTATGLSVTADSTAAITAPLVIGDNGTLTNNGGTITGATTIGSVQFGNNAQITNNGTITSTASGTGAAAIIVGTNSTVTNNGVLTAVSGTPAVQFAAGGTFINTAAATAAVTGTIALGANTGTSVGTLINQNTAYGLTTAVTATGNASIDNAGLWTGSFTQYSAPGTASFLNEAAGTFTGTINTQDPTTLTNNGTMTLYSSVLGSALNGTSTLTNNASLAVGTTTTSAIALVNGNFAQSAAGTLTIAIKPASGATIAAGTNYSQVHATGTASLGGTLALNVAAGFYPTGSTYNVVLADSGISGNFASVTGNALTFITFVPTGVVTISGTSQAYQFQVVRTTTYAAALAATANANELAIATALQPLVATASTTPTGAAATLIGEIDVLTAAQAQTMIDGLSPAGYYAYATALRDQTNAFTRQVDLRLRDQNSDHPEDGWWGSVAGQVDFSSATADRAKGKLFGFYGGYDFSGPHFVAGLAGTYSWNSLHNSPETLSGSNRAGGIEAYGALRLGMLRFTGQLGYMFGHLGATKTFTADTTATSASASSSEHMLKATATAGVDFTVGGVLIEPFAGIDYKKGAINGFTETNAGAANLTVASIKADRTDLLAGVDLNKASGMWRPYVRVAYRSAIGNADAPAISAYFNGDSTTTFLVNPTSDSRHEIDANVGLNVVFDDAGSVFVGYQGTMRSGYSSHGINAGVRIEF